MNQDPTKTPYLGKVMAWAVLVFFILTFLLVLGFGYAELFNLR